MALLHDIVKANIERRQFISSLSRQHMDVDPQDIEHLFIASWREATDLYGSCLMYVHNHGRSGFAQLYRVKNLYAYKAVGKYLRGGAS